MVDKNSEKSAFEIWKLGVRLWDAPDAFGATKALARIRRQARLAARANAEMGKANFRKAGANADAFIDALEPALALLNSASETRTAQEDRLFERLRTGELIALGFPTHDADAATPIQVPPFLLERRYTQWKRGSFEGLGRHYASVTICEAPLTRSSADEPPTTKKRTGRPSYSEGLEIVAAVLERKNVQLDSRPWKPLYFQVRSLGIEMQLRKFNNEQPDDETIRRFLFKRAAPKPGLKTQ